MKSLKYVRQEIKQIENITIGEKVYVINNLKHNNNKDNGIDRR